MFDTTWQNPQVWQEAILPAVRVRSKLDAGRVERVALLHWEEHCLECAPPVCYQHCALYIRRPDRKCARLVYGIQPDPRFEGGWGYGADVKFRRWAKLESRFHPRMLPLESARRLDRVNRWLARTTRNLAERLVSFSPKLRLTGLLNGVRELTLLHTCGNGDTRFDAFVLECYSLEPAPFRLLFRCHREGGPFFEHSFLVTPGHNLFELRREEMNAPQWAPGSFLMLFPEKDLEARLVLLWCDLVSYRPTPGGLSPAVADGQIHGSQRPEVKVKCVCWDLDGTFWQGILIEDGPARVRLRPGVRELAKALDERGILQSIVSKNDYEQAWPVLEREGLADYFVCPAINWNPKSHNFRQLAGRLNLGLDTFALVDDSAFERAEVTSALPTVRAYSAGETEKLLDYPEFRVPITIASRERRLSYQTELRRQRVQQESGLQDEEFLRSCQMTLEIDQPRDEAGIRRCWELCRRSNQLNLSTRRYSEPEFRDLLAAHPGNCFALRCRDRFGDYGIVGFASLAEEGEGEGAELVDLVISCRVARKRVERTFIEWLDRQEYQRGKRRLRANLIKAKKNGPMTEVIAGLPFQVRQINGKSIYYEMELHAQLPLDDCLTVLVET